MAFRVAFPSLETARKKCTERPVAILQSGDFYNRFPRLQLAKSFSEVYGYDDRTGRAGKARTSCEIGLAGVSLGSPRRAVSVGFPAGARDASIETNRRTSEHATDRAHGLILTPERSTHADG
jgi:hypothetical protein